MTAHAVYTSPLGARYASPYSPSIAVDDAGDVLLAYAYGLQSTHATLLPAGTDHFLAPTVLSSLGHGGTPTAAFAANRDPLVAFADRSGVFLADALRGTPVNLRAPQANADPLDPAELRDHTRVTARVGCSSTCVVSVGWRITTGGRGIDGTAPTVISRHGMSGEILRAGERRSFTFDAKPSAADSLLGSGRAKASVSITVANASGVSRTIRQRVEFGCVRTTTSCPRTAGG